MSHVCCRIPYITYVMENTKWWREVCMTLSSLSSMYLPSSRSCRLTLIDGQRYLGIKCLHVWEVDGVFLTDAMKAEYSTLLVVLRKCVPINDFTYNSNRRHHHQVPFDGGKYLLVDNAQGPQPVQYSQARKRTIRERSKILNSPFFCTQLLLLASRV